MDQCKIINHTFKFRVGDTDEKGGCTFIGGTWKDVTTNDLFKDKKVLLFSLPGAFTPTCSGQQLPTYDDLVNHFKSKGFDAVYCISVNDAFVIVFLSKGGSSFIISFAFAIPIAYALPSLSSSNLPAQLISSSL